MITSILRSLLWNELMELVFGSSNTKFIYTGIGREQEAIYSNFLGILQSLSDYKASARLVPEMTSSPPHWEPFCFG